MDGLVGGMLPCVMVFMVAVGLICLGIGAYATVQGLRAGVWHIPRWRRWMILWGVCALVWLLCVGLALWGR